MGISDLEAVLFSAAKPISIDVIQDIFKLSKQDSLTLIDHLASDLESHKRGIRVRISAAGVELVSAPESAMYIGHIRKKEDKLSNAAMETVEKDAYSLEDMIVSLASRARRGERLAFRELLVAIESKSGMVTIFMAVLELLKQQELVMFYENDDIIFTAPIIGERDVQVEEE